MVPMYTNWLYQRAIPTGMKPLEFNRIDRGPWFSRWVPMMSMRGPQADRDWTSRAERCQVNRTHVFENYGGLEMTQTSDLFRVNLAKAILLLLFPPK